MQRLISAMKLLVHNFLSSKFLKGVSTGFPLKLVATEVKTVDRDFDAQFTTRMLSKVDWAALRLAADSLHGGEELKLPDALPQTPAPDTAAVDEPLMRKIHKLLFEVDVIEGYLECPETGRQFPIKNGIPNMLANEDEVA